MRSVIVYTAARLALFGATAGVLYLAGARGFLLLALAILISGIVSFVLLSRQRDAISAAVSERVAYLRQSFAEGAAREDDDEPAEPAERAEPAGNTAEPAGNAEAPEPAGAAARPADEGDRPRSA